MLLSHIFIIVVYLWYCRVHLSYFYYCILFIMLLSCFIYRIFVVVLFLLSCFICCVIFLFYFILVYDFFFCPIFHVRPKSRIRTRPKSNPNFVAQSRPNNAAAQQEPSPPGLSFFPLAACMHTDATSLYPETSWHCSLHGSTAKWCQVWNMVRWCS